MFKNIKITAELDRENVYTMEFPTLSVQTNCSDDRSIKMALTDALCEHFGFIESSGALQEIKYLLMAKDCYYQSVGLINIIQNVIGRESIFARIENINIESENTTIGRDHLSTTRNIILQMHQKIVDKEIELDLLKQELLEIKKKI